MLVTVASIKFKIGNKEIVSRIFPLGDIRKKILIQGIPLHLPDEDALQFFSQYGDNITIYHPTSNKSGMHLSKYLHGVWDGDRIIYMQVKNKFRYHYFLMKRKFSLLIPVKQYFVQKCGY